LVPLARGTHVPHARARLPVPLPELSGVPGVRRRPRQARGPRLPRRWEDDRRRRPPADRRGDALLRRAVAPRRPGRGGRRAGSRLAYLVEVGLEYLTLDRQSRTLSGGELERVDLTTAIGSSLVNTLYVLDEPSIGLHPRDTERLTRLLHRLRDQGNAVVVVE